MEIKLFVPAVVCYFIALLGAISTSPLVPWVTFRAESKRGNTLDSEYQITLYKQFREDKGADNGPFDNDDVTEIDDDDFQSYQAIEFNRGTTVITLLAAFLIGTFYLLSGAGALNRNLHAEFGCGLFTLFLAILCWSGSGYWINRMTRDFYEDRQDTTDFKDEVNCSAGCALQLTNSFLCLFLALIMLGIAYADSKTQSASSPDHKAIDTANQKTDKAPDVELTVEDKDGGKKPTAPPAAVVVVGNNAYVVEASHVCSMVSSFLPCWIASYLLPSVVVKKFAPLPPCEKLPASADAHKSSEVR